VGRELGIFLGGNMTKYEGKMKKYEGKIPEPL